MKNDIKEKKESADNEGMEACLTFLKEEILWTTNTLLTNDLTHNYHLQVLYHLTAFFYKYLLINMLDK